MEPVVYTPVSAKANLRRSTILGVALALIAIVICGVQGHLFMGVFGLLGIVLGAANNLMLQRSVIRYATNELIGKSQFRRGVIGRLFVFTLVGVGCAALDYPDGLGVFFGLAVFQVIMLVGAAMPVFRSLRTTS